VSAASAVGLPVRRLSAYFAPLSWALLNGWLAGHSAAACVTPHRYSAPGGRQVVCFVDDLNLPARAACGAQPPLELLRQLQDAGGWYDRRQLLWRRIEGVTLCAACVPPGGGRQEVSPRCVRVCVCGTPQEACLCINPAAATPTRTPTHTHTHPPTRQAPAPLCGACGAAALRHGHQGDPVWNPQRLPAGIPARSAAPGGVGRDRERGGLQQVRCLCVCVCVVCVGGVCATRQPAAMLGCLGGRCAGHWLRSAG
jgi:hypothetical protein